MTYLIVALAILALTEVFTLTILGKRNRDIQYYTSAEYKNAIFTSRARHNSKKWQKNRGAE